MEKQSIGVLDRDNAVKNIDHAFDKATQLVSESGWLDSLFSAFAPLTGTQGQGEAINAQKEVLLNKKHGMISALGLDGGTPDGFRLVFYEDEARKVVFKGQVNDDGGIRITDSMVLPDSGSDLAGSFKALPRPIDLPAPAYKVNANGVKEGNIELSLEQSKVMANEAAMVVMAHDAVNGGIESGSAVPNAPYGKGTQRAR